MVTTVSTTTITPRLTGVGISGTAALTSTCSQCGIGFTPLNARISDSPA